MPYDVDWNAAELAHVMDESNADFPRKVSRRVASIPMCWLMTSGLEEPLGG